MVTEGDEDLEVEYDSDGYPIIPDRAKVSSPSHTTVYRESVCYSYCR